MTYNVFDETLKLAQSVKSRVLLYWYVLILAVVYEEYDVELSIAPAAAAAVNATDTTPIILLIIIIVILTWSQCKFGDCWFGISAVLVLISCYLLMECLSVHLSVCLLCFRVTPKWFNY